MAVNAQKLKLLMLPHLALWTDETTVCWTDACTAAATDCLYFLRRRPCPWNAKGRWDRVMSKTELTMSLALFFILR